MPERLSRERQPAQQRARREQPQINSDEVEQREPSADQLTLAVRQLLDALDRCAGDPPDCPHCGEARRFAIELLQPTPVDQPIKELGPEHEIRLQLAGRVGADPVFRTTPKGTLVGRFPLAIHNPDNTTTWQQVLAFNARAEKLKDTIHKGDAVQVVGYMHERQGKDREGQPRTIRELYAVSVTARAR